MQIGQLVLRNPFLLAPMAGVTNLPFRMIVREYGCSLAFTEMVSANGLVRGADRTHRYLDSNPADKPVGVQLFGAEPDVLAEAARMISDTEADLIDINMGCPVRKVIKSGAGAALLREPNRVAEIVAAVRKATSLPLTVKIRSGWSARQINALAIAKRVEDCGADALIIHARTADQGFSGRADWEVIRQVKERLRIPVIGNGDILRPEDTVRMMEQTRCDGIMVGRAALGNPWIFRSILAAADGKSGERFPLLPERRDIMERHLRMEMAYIGDRQGVRSFRKHLLWYTKGLRGGAAFRNQVSPIDCPEAVLQALDRYFQYIDNMGDISDK